MNKEAYLWLLLILTIAAVALYFRYFYQAQIGVALSLNATGINTSLYPYQRVSLPILVYNSGGSAIKNLSVGIFINNNFMVPYKVTLPQGKQVIIRYNYTPSLPGTYNIVISADPGKLYNIADRSKTMASVTLLVEAPENATPYKLVPATNQTSLHETDFNKGGYIVQAYLNSNYKVSDFTLVNSTEIGRVIMPLLNSTFNDISNISVSVARYANNDSAYSIWIRGYLDPSVVLAIFSNASEVSSQRATVPFGNITYIRMQDSTTLCGWYAGGWLKLFGFVGSRTCYQMLSTSMAMNGMAPSFSRRPVLENVSTLANYTGRDGNERYAATLAFVKSSFIYARVSNWTNTNTNGTCFGIIDSANGASYCSTYITPISGRIGNLSLVRTTAYVGEYNLSVFSLSNTSRLLDQVPININVIRGFNISGNYLQFKSALSDTCSLNASFPCSDVTFANGTIKINVANNIGKAVRLNGLGCYLHGAFNSTSLGAITLATGKSANLTTPCFDNGTVLKGILINLNLNLLLNYTVMNRTQTLTGKAQVPFG